MSIHFVAGKPGAGKSLYAVKILLDELEHSDRHICTNLPLKVDEIAQYLIEKTGTSDALRRLRILTDGEVLRFWLHYGVGHDVSSYKKFQDGDKTLEVPDYSWRQDPANGFPGTLYILDEIQVHFPARSWHKTGEHCLHYQSQHRHLGDDVILLSQDFAQVDSAMRRLCQDFTWLTNMGKTSLFGFTFPGIGRRATYQHEKDAEKGGHAIETGTYRLNVKYYGKFYDTTAGSGGLLGRADIKEKKGRGMSPWLIPPAIAIFLVLCWVVPKLFFAVVGKFAGHAVGGLSSVSAQMSTNVVKMPQGYSGPSTNNVPDVRSTNLVRPFLPVPETPKATNAPLKIVRRAIIGSSRTYWLSDGRRFKSDDPNLQFAGEDYIIIRPNLVVWFDK